MPRSRHLLLLVPAILIVGCASTHEATDETLEELLTRAMCEARVRCGMRSDVRPCVGRELRYPFVASWGDRFALDPTRALACLELLRSPECVVPNQTLVPLICRDIRVIHPRGEGRRCLGSAECADGMLCRHDLDESEFTCFEGICTPPPARCENHRDCRTPPDAIGVDCVDGACVPEFLRATVGSGEPCGFIDDELIECGLGLACVFDPDVREPRCGRMPQLGQRCDFSATEGLCAEGLVCPAGDASPRFCEVPARARQGERCALTWPSECDLGTACVDGICVPSSGELGQPCTDWSQCREGLRCEFGGRCAPFLPLGAPCSSFLECDGMGCEDGRCVAHCSE